MPILYGIAAGALGYWFATDDISFGIGYLAYLVVVFGIRAETK